MEQVICYVTATAIASESPCRRMISDVHMLVFIGAPLSSLEFASFLASLALAFLERIGLIVSYSRISYNERKEDKSITKFI